MEANVKYGNENGEDCLGKYFDAQAEECKRCSMAKECEEKTLAKTTVKKKEEVKTEIEIKKPAKPAKPTKATKPAKPVKSKKPAEPVKSVEAAKPTELAKAESKGAENPFKSGFGSYVVFEELVKGGTWDEILARVKEQFGKQGIKSVAKGRLDRIIVDTGKGNLSHCAIKKEGDRIQLVSK